MDEAKLAKLKAWYNEELSDSAKYKEASNEFPEFCGIFEDLAEEEQSHAVIIKYVLEHI